MIELSSRGVALTLCETRAEMLLLGGNADFVKLIVVAGATAGLPGFNGSFTEPWLIEA